MPKGFEPWIAVKVGVRKNRKLAGLPDDTARYGWIAGVLAEAKLQRPGGRFDSRGQLEEAIGRFAGYVDNYLAAGLLEVAGRLCTTCRKVWTALPAGSYVVHDWRAHQRDPFSAARAEAWREEHDAEPENDGRTTDERTANGDGTTDERRSNASDSQDERATNTVDSPDVTADSRARGETQDSRQRTDTSLGSLDVEYPAPDAAEPTLSRAQLEAWASFGPEWDGVKAAWIGRGFRKPPTGSPTDDDTSQRGLLWQILDAQPTSLPRWIAMASGKTPRQVIDWVLAQWHEVRVLDEDEPEPDVASDPTSTPESAREILQRLGEDMPDWARKPEPAEVGR